ncbi:MAG: valine--tRNA ligase, partial [Acetobacteraceae bacterium]
PVLLHDASAESKARAERWIEPIRRMARAAEVSAVSRAVSKGSAQAVLDEATLEIPLLGLIDVQAERTRLEKDRAKTSGEADKVRRKLANDDFVRRAPVEVVEENRERLAGIEAEITRLDAALRRIE